MNSEKSINALIHKIENHYERHGVNIDIPEYEVLMNEKRIILSVHLKKGSRRKQFFDRATDVQMSLGIPFFWPFQDGVELFIAVSSHSTAKNSFLDIINSDIFYESSGIPYAVGRDLRGEMVVANLRQMNHLLLAGATGSGKTVALRSLILSAARCREANNIGLVLIDTGASDLKVFDTLPILCCPIVEDVETAVRALQALVQEVERRKTLHPDKLERLPYLICVVDEFVSLISQSESVKRENIVNAINTLLRRGRHTNVHVVLATQDTRMKSIKVDLGNVTSRIAFSCAKYHDSITILGKIGAEQLTGEGAMLFKTPSTPEPIHVQGAYVHTRNIETLLPQIVQDITSREINSFSIDTTTKSTQNTVILSERASAKRKEIVDIALWALGRNEISTLQIQKRFRIGNRASEIMEELYQKGLVAEKFANQPRTVLPCTAKEIPDSLKTFLINNGATEREIATAFSLRSGIKSVRQNYAEDEEYVQAVKQYGRDAILVLAMKRQREREQDKMRDMSAKKNTWQPEQK
jgi:S-DNA-T family DNA segregation ATPase FtsK/SpoIIIE